MEVNVWFRTCVTVDVSEKLLKQLEDGEIDTEKFAEVAGISEADRSNTELFEVYDRDKEETVFEVSDF
jgi:hypothetical protein